MKNSQAVAQLYKITYGAHASQYGPVSKRSKKNECRHKTHPVFKLCTVASVAFIIYCLSMITISDHQQDKSYTAGELNPLLLMAGTASAAFEI